MAASLGWLSLEAILLLPSVVVVRGVRVTSCRGVVATISSVAIAGGVSSLLLAPPGSGRSVSSAARKR